MIGSGRGGEWVRAGLCGKRRSLEFARGSCDGPTQVIDGVGMAAWKLRTAELEDGTDISQGCAAPQQFLGDPLVGDTPVGLREALRNEQAVQVSLIDVDGGGGSERGNRRRVRPLNDGREGIRRRALGRFQQRGAACRQAEVSVEESYERGVTVGATPLHFRVGESGEAAQMAPIGAGRISAIATGEISADGGGDSRLQWFGADAHPGLEMAGAGLEHHTGLMSVSAHGGDDVWIGVIQIEENVAAVERMGAGVEIDVEPLAIAGAQECNRWRRGEQTSRPDSFTGARRSGLVVDQPDEIRFIGHGRELTANPLEGNEESVIAHERDYEFTVARYTIDFQRTVIVSFPRVSPEGVTPREFVHHSALRSVRRHHEHIENRRAALQNHLDHRLALRVKQGILARLV